MGAAVILAFSEQQHLGRVTAGCTNPGHVARQALAVTRCRDMEVRLDTRSERKRSVTGCNYTSRHQILAECSCVESRDGQSIEHLDNMVLSCFTFVIISDTFVAQLLLSLQMIHRLIRLQLHYDYDIQQECVVLFCLLHPCL